MVSLKYSFWRPTNTLKTWFRKNIRFGELSSTVLCVVVSVQCVKCTVCSGEIAVSSSQCAVFNCACSVQ